MGKDSALGQDPLRWMRVTKENRKPSHPEDVNKAAPNVEKHDKRIISQTTIKQQKPISTSDNRLRDVQKTATVQTSKEFNSVANNTSTPKSKVVIGRMYEKPLVEKIKQSQAEGDVSLEQRYDAKQPSPSYKAGQTLKVTDYRPDRVASSSYAFSLSTYIIIAYTALMLILGFFIYGDLSKRMGRMEAKVIALEKILHAKE